MPLENCARCQDIRKKAQAMLDAFGGHVPEWLRPEAEALATALAGGGDAKTR